MFRCTPKDLAIGIVLVFIGLAISQFMFTYSEQTLGWKYPALPFLIWCAVGAICGAGMFYPFELEHVGVVLGIFIQMVTYWFFSFPHQWFRE